MSLEITSEIIQLRTFSGHFSFICKTSKENIFEAFSGQMIFPITKLVKK